jgi:hypothetical protein
MTDNSKRIGTAIEAHPPRAYRAEDAHGRMVTHLYCAEVHALLALLDEVPSDGHVAHRLAEIIRFRMLMIAAGYEDGNDADALRRDPMFKLALDRLPAGEELCSQSTISRLENLPDRRALLRLGPALVEQYCGSFRAVLKRIVLDIDDTPPLSRGQALRPRAWRPATAPV